eukprot:gnl/MRDRNA2_/MRDRNA2_63615_c0_seq1.p1 gnl/MRDRNA2_/MRDRNA2_63615_c0~~gnl/MRDRNA2_/MRDRNA2_63615_c0_seq1.p1  ORF type:complete len:405 (+),score=69.60 gnl/MRDRNA2_/MRDRNA2_63615_c0_seq1:3-1217(+)
MAQAIFFKVIIGSKGKMWILSFFAYWVMAATASFIPTIHVEYPGTLEGHFSLGRSIGAAVGKDIHDKFSVDSELEVLLRFVSDGAGKSLFQKFLTDSSTAFPEYLEEVKGMADGANISVHDLLVSNFREELLQFVPDLSDLRRHKGKCSTAYAMTSDTTAFGHNDDWSKDWRNASYIISGVETSANGSDASKRWTSWVYPGYLPGMDISFNDHGVVYTVQSLFPKSFPKQGIGTAFVARHLLEATSLEDAVKRATDSRVAAAMVYNLGSVEERRMVELEVNSFGKYSRLNITEPHFHANMFILSDVPQAVEASSAHRMKTWDRLRPSSVAGIRSFLGDTSDPEYPVYRSHVPPDDCFTEISAIFDLRSGTLEVWNTNPRDTPSLVIFDLLAAGTHLAENIELHV